MQFVNTTVYCISQNAKSRGSHPRLFCVERRSFIPCSGRRTDRRIYSISHLSRFVNTTICGIFYFVARHTAMVIWWIRAAVRTSAAARIITTFSTISNFASSIRSNRRTILCTRSRLAISHPFLFLRFVLLITLRFAIICIYLSITHSIAHPRGKIHRILSPARFYHKLE